MRRRCIVARDDPCQSWGVMTLDELLSAVDALVSQRETERSSREGEGNFRCEDCVGCLQCRFCVACVECEECTYCEGCLDCRSCTQCKRSSGCHDASYVDDSRDCSASKYLMLCVDCRDCTYCLGCVGLQGAEFHVLNQPVERKQYFALVKELKDVLEARAAEGFRPSFVFPEGFEDEDEPAAEDAVTKEASPEEGIADGIPVAPLEDADPWLDAPMYAGSASGTSPGLARLGPEDLRDESAPVRLAGPNDDLDVDPWLGPIEDDLAAANAAARSSLARGARPSAARSGSYAHDDRDPIDRARSGDAPAASLASSSARTRSARAAPDPAGGRADSSSGQFGRGAASSGSYGDGGGSRASASSSRSTESSRGGSREYPTRTREPQSGSHGAAELIRRADWTSSASASGVGAGTGAGARAPSGSGAHGGGRGAPISDRNAEGSARASRASPARPHSSTDIASTWSARELRAFADQSLDDDPGSRSASFHRGQPATPHASTERREQSSAHAVRETGSASWGRAGERRTSDAGVHRPWQQDAWGQEDAAYPQLIDDERPSEPIELEPHRSRVRAPAEPSLRRGTRPKPPPRR